MLLTILFPLTSFTRKKPANEESDRENTAFLTVKNNDLETCVKVLNFFSTIERIKEDKIPQIIQDRKCNVMINTSNRCNLNCSYCYRDKKNSNVISISTIDKIFKFIKKFLS